MSLREPQAEGEESGSECISHGRAACPWRGGRWWWKSSPRLWRALPDPWGPVRSTSQAVGGLGPGAMLRHSSVHICPVYQARPWVWSGVRVVLKQAGVSSGADGVSGFLGAPLPGPATFGCPPPPRGPYPSSQVFGQGHLFKTRSPDPSPMSISQRPLPGRGHPEPGGREQRQ